MKASTEQLLLAISQVVNAAAEKRSDLPNELVAEIIKIRAKIQHLKELNCE